MSKTIKALWARRPRLNRGWQVLRNLTVFLLVSLFLWGANDFPVPHNGLAFRRAERANWVGPSDIQGTFHQWTLGVCGDWVLLQYWGGNTFEYWPRSQTGATLCPLPDRPSMEGEARIIAVEVPKGTVSAKLDIVTYFYLVPTEEGARASAAPGQGDQHPEKRELRCSLEGQRVNDKMFAFHVEGAEPEEDYEVWWLVSNLSQWPTYTQPPEKRDVNCTLEAVFYDQNGVELGRASLASPEN